MTVVEEAVYHSLFFKFAGRPQPRNTTTAIAHIYKDDCPRIPN